MVANTWQYLPAWVPFAIWQPKLISPPLELLASSNFTERSIWARTQGTYEQVPHPVTANYGALLANRGYLHLAPATLLAGRARRLDSVGEGTYCVDRCQIACQQSVAPEPMLTVLHRIESRCARWLPPPGARLLEGPFTTSLSTGRATPQLDDVGRLGHSKAPTIATPAINTRGKVRTCRSTQTEP